MDTEVETGGEGAGEMFTGGKSKIVVHRKRAVVTRKLVPFAGGPQHFLRAANSNLSSSRELLEKAFDEGILCFK